jgi:hypothetical protein
VAKIAAIAGKPVALILKCMTIVAALSAVAFEVGHAQQNPSTRELRPIFVGSASENYLRYLQTLGLAAGEPWSVRGFSPIQLRALSSRSGEHPWAGATWFEGPSAGRKVNAKLLPIVFSSWYNTNHPYGINDGPVWVGRGLTSAIDLGFVAEAGPVSLSVAPTVFWSRNEPFALLPTGLPGSGVFRDPLLPNSVDKPQRFGSRPYGRVDPGQTTLRVDYLGLSTGFSTANQWFGPMQSFPFVLGNNAPGFPHVFLGTAAPADVVIGRIHSRVLYARLDQSPYSPVSGAESRRFASGLAVVFLPRGLTGLELGVARFFHVAWPEQGLSSAYFLHILETFVKQRIKRVLAPTNDDPNQSADNQLASLFARWRTTGSGFEIYTEFGREDHNWDLRDYLLEPDHSSTLSFGMRKAWMASPRVINSLSLEVMDGAQSILGRHRGEGGIYVHGLTPQGHTHRGQLLASGIGVGEPAGASFSWSQFTPSGSHTIALDRLAANPLEVQYAASVRRYRAWATDFTTEVGLTMVRTVTGQPGRDRINWRFDVGLSWIPRVSETQQR